MIYLPHANSKKKKQLYVGKTAPSILSTLKQQVITNRPAQVQLTTTSFDTNFQTQVRNNNQVANLRKQQLKKITTQGTMMLELNTKKPQATRFIQQVATNTSGTQICCWNDVQMKLFLTFATRNPIMDSIDMLP